MAERLPSDAIFAPITGPQVQRAPDLKEGAALADSDAPMESEAPEIPFRGAGEGPQAPRNKLPADAEFDFETPVKIRVKAHQRVHPRSVTGAKYTANVPLRQPEAVSPFEFRPEKGVLMPPGSETLQPDHVFKPKGKINVAKVQAQDLDRVASMRASTPSERQADVQATDQREKESAMYAAQKEWYDAYGPLAYSIIQKGGTALENALDPTETVLGHLAQSAEDLGFSNSYFHRKLAERRAEREMEARVQGRVLGEDNGFLYGQALPELTSMVGQTLLPHLVTRGVLGNQPTYQGEVVNPPGAAQGPTRPQAGVPGQAPGQLGEGTLQGEEVYRPSGPVEPSRPPAPAMVSGQVGAATGLVPYESPNQLRVVDFPTGQEPLPGYSTQYGKPVGADRTGVHFLPESEGTGIQFPYREPESSLQVPLDWLKPTPQGTDVSGLGPSPFEGDTTPPYRPYAQGLSRETTAGKINLAKARVLARKSLSKESLQELATMRNKIQTRDDGNGISREFAELSNVPMAGNPIGEALLKAPVDELAENMLEMGGDPEKFGGNPDLMARWVMRELGNRLGGSTQSETVTPASTEVQQDFERRLAEQRPQDDLEKSALEKLNFSTREQALGLMHEIALFEANKHNPFITQEDIAKGNRAWDVLQDPNDPNGGLKLSRPEFHRLRQLYAEAQRAKSNNLLREIEPRLEAPDQPPEVRSAVEALKRIKLQSQPIQDLFGEKSSASLEPQAPATSLSEAAGQQLEKLAKTGDTLTGAEASLGDKIRELLGAGTPENPRVVTAFTFTYPGGVNKPAMVKAPTSFWKVYEAATGVADATGLNVADYLYRPLEQGMTKGLPSEVLTPFMEAMDRARAEAKALGLRSIQFIRYGLGEENELITAHHETIHAGQNKALPPEAQHSTELHDPTWAKADEYVNTALQTPFGQSIVEGSKFDPHNHMAMELAAYSAESPQGARALGLDPAQSLDYLRGYLEHVLDFRGPEAIQKFSEPVIMRSGVADLFDWIKEKANDVEQRLFQPTGGQSPYGLQQAESSYSNAISGGAPEAGSLERTGYGTGDVVGTGASGTGTGRTDSGLMGISHQLGGGGGLVPPGGGPLVPPGGGPLPSPQSLPAPTIKNLKDLLSQLDETILGRDLWQRAGGLVNKMALAPISIAGTNAITSLMQVPLRAAALAPAGILYGVQKGLSVIDEARNAMQGPIQIALSLNPLQFLKLTKTGTGPFSYRPQRYVDVQNKVNMLKTAFPELTTKLSGVSFGNLQALGPGQQLLQQANQMATQLPGMSAKDVNRLAVFNQRAKMNQSLFGKGLRAAESFYEFFLHPQMWQEFFFRDPMMLGELMGGSERAGFDLAQAWRLGPPGVANAPKDVVDNAMNESLQFSMAWMPSQGLDTQAGNPGFSTMNKHMQEAAYHGIKLINEMGPLGMMIQGFPKMLANNLLLSSQYSPLGLIGPANKIYNKMKGNPFTKWGFDDWHDMTKAIVGTALFWTALEVRRKIGGPEWWQLKTGATSANGTPEYLDGRKYPPFVTSLYLADLVDRIGTGRFPNDPKQIGKDLVQVLLGASGATLTGDVAGSLTSSMYDWWSEGLDPSWDSLKRNAGKVAGQYISLPLNFLKTARNVWASAKEEENRKSDFRSSPILGPSIDTIPWVRRKYLGPATSPTEGQVPLGSHPALQALTGLNLVPGQNPAGEELSKLGLSMFKYLPPDKDEKINREQNTQMYEMLNQLGSMIMEDPSYTTADVQHKRARWEQSLSGPKGMAASAHKAALQANIPEAIRRAAKRGIGPETIKAEGIDKVIEDMIKQDFPE